MSLVPVTSVSYVNFPLDVASATEAVMTPGFFKRVDSIRWTHEEHVIPSIFNCKWQKNDHACALYSPKNHCNLWTKIKCTVPAVQDKAASTQIS